jgi:hypothetical protein
MLASLLAAEAQSTEPILYIAALRCAQESTHFNLVAHYNVIHLDGVTGPEAKRLMLHSAGDHIKNDTAEVKMVQVGLGDNGTF